MQKTLTIDDDLLRQAEQLAAERAVSVDAMVSGLLRQALARVPASRPDNGFPIFPRLPGLPLITTQGVRDAEDDH